MAKGKAPGRLAILIGDDSAGVLLNKSGRQTFVYDSGWLKRRDAYPLSQCLPLVPGEFPPRLVGAFFWGVLPDNERILTAIAEQHETSPRSLMGLLAAVGGDCPGAIRILPEETAFAPERETEEILWLSEREVADRLSRLTAMPLGRRANEAGQFSLAGAQPKTAFIRDDKGRYGIPQGRIPTTHILKPPSQGFDGFSENEHFCLQLADRLGLKVANSWVERFEDQVSIVVERYDRRQQADGRIMRVHQEDFCQASGVPPENKYQTMGGPGPKECLSLLDSSGDPETDKTRFILALAYNWIVGGTDGHAKNYSLLYAPGQIRMAPLYDIASATAYPDRFDMRGLKMAMKIDGKAEFSAVYRRHWDRLIKHARMDEDRVIAQIVSMARSAPDLAIDVAARCRAEGLTHSILPKLVDAVSSGSAAALKALES